MKLKFIEITKSNEKTFLSTAISSPMVKLRNMLSLKNVESNNKNYLLGIAVFVFLMGILLSRWPGSHSAMKDMGWVLRQLPEVKAIEYLDALKKD